MSEKQIMSKTGSFTPASDSWVCRDCAFVFGGYGRSPPYPHCPDCDNPMLSKAQE